MMLNHPSKLDVERMYELFQSAQVRKSDIDRKVVPKRGFYDYNLTYEAFAARLAEKETSLVLRRGNEIIAYAITFPVSQIQAIQKSQHDVVLEEISGADPKAIYWDQLFIKDGLPIYYAGRLFESLTHILRAESVPALIAAIPQEPWQNTSSTKFALTHGFKQESKVNEEEMTLGLFTKPFWNIGADAQESYKLKLTSN